MKARFLLLVLITVFAGQVVPLRANLSKDSLFDEYGTFITWPKEQLALSNFAFFLQKNPEQVGYIAYHVEEGKSFRRSRTRILKARKYLINVRKIPASRIVVLCAGNGPSSKTILQPWLKGKEFFLKPGACKD